MAATEGELVEKKGRRPSRLLLPTGVAKERLVDWIRLGRQLLDRDVNSEDDWSEASARYNKWSQYNETLLRNTLFDSDDEVITYQGSISVPPGNPTFRERVGLLGAVIKTKIHRLESLVERIELFHLSPEATSATPRDENAQPNHHGGGRKVFVVHGRDDAVQQAVARVIERLQLEPVILSEQADKGRTIIEKFTDHAQQAIFAVVLLTGDDEGRLFGSNETPSRRARQNVILELGYFLARLGPERVCALYVNDVELPSDISGRLYVPYDGPNGAWRFRLIQEMGAAGISVDANRILRP
jgi:predicted nucleotide-binding protein